jgi:hypothetical protein
MSKSWLSALSSIPTHIPLVSTNKVGFRLSLIDCGLIIAGLLLTWFYPHNKGIPANMDFFFQAMILYVIGSFFLFCNVFRVRRKYELWWVASALINTLLLLFYYNNILVFFITQSVFTAIAVIMEIKSATYHGIFAKKGTI